jgi:glutaredoxin
MLTKVVVYTREGCHLCERVIAQLEKLNSTSSLDISTKDITEDAELFERYRNIIPVISIDGRVGLAGEALANPRTLESTLRKALSMPI